MNTPLVCRPAIACLVAAVALVVSGCGSSPPASRPLTERPFAEVFEVRSRVRLQGVPEDPIANPTAMVRWSDRVVVVDEMQANLKLFNLAGTRVGTIGRAGDGPGEFRRPFAAAVLPDGGLAVLDRTGLRVSHFSPSGEYLSRWPVEGFAPMGVSSLGDGRLLVGVKLPNETPGAEGRLRIYAADGTAGEPFGALVARTPQEASFQQMYPVVVGHVALAVANNRPAVRLHDLRSGRSWTAEYGAGLVPTAEWAEVKDGTPPGDYLKWANRQHWTSYVVPLDTARFLMMVKGPMDEGRPNLRYVVGDVDGNTLAVTAPTQMAVLHAARDTLYGMEATEDGEFDLLTYGLRLDGAPAAAARPDHQASR